MFNDDKLNNHKNEFYFTPRYRKQIGFKYSEANLLQIVITVELYI